MLFTAVQASPRVRVYTLDCPHGTFEHQSEERDGSRDPEMLAGLVRYVHQSVMQAYLDGKVGEPCACEPQGWRGSHEPDAPPA